MSTIFPFIEKVKFEIAEKISPIQFPAISSFDLLDLEMSAPKMYLVGDILLQTSIIEDDLSEFDFKPLVKNVTLFGNAI